MDKMDTWDDTPIFNLFRDILKNNFVKTKNGEDQYRFFHNYKPEKILEILHNHDKKIFNFNPKEKEGNAVP